MSSGKSIFVMDTPKACDECPLSLETEEIDTIICRGCEKYSINPKCTERPDWCPLKEMPGKYPKSQEWFSEEYVEGRNDCIDGILKGSSQLTK